jgi:hypothetical protein
VSSSDCGEDEKALLVKMMLKKGGEGKVRSGRKKRDIF